MSQITIGGTTLNFKDSAFTGDQWEQVASWVLNGGAEGIDANAQIATEKAAAASASAADARNSATSAGESATAAASSATAAKASEDAAAGSATNAAASATSAGNSSSAASEKASDAANSASAAATSAQTAQSAAGAAEDAAGAASTAAEAASGSASQARESAAAAAESAASVDGINKTAQSWAVGGTGTREGENTDNAKYYSEQAGEVVNSLNNAHIDESGHLVYTSPDGSTVDLGEVVGKDGVDGSSIQSIERTSGTGEPGTTDTYTVTLTNGDTTIFQVYNGKDGSGSGDMTKAVYDPQGKAQDIYAYADTKYRKPSGGIPKTDLASAVQTSLSKADSALQSVPATYRTASEQDTIDNGKQAKITASGILKGDGNGGVTAAAPGTDYSGPKATVTATLLASGWTGSEAHFVYTLAIAGVTATSYQELVPAVNITAEQLKALQAANITDGGQAAGTMTLKAYGKKPAVDIPIRVIKEGE